MNDSKKIINKLKTTDILEIRANGEFYLGRFLEFGKDKQSIIVIPYYKPTDINTEVHKPKEIFLSEIEELKFSARLPNE